MSFYIQSSITYKVVFGWARNSLYGNEKAGVYFEGIAGISTSKTCSLNAIPEGIRLIWAFNWPHVLNLRNLYLQMRCYS